MIERMIQRNITEKLKATIFSSRNAYILSNPRIP